MKHPYSKKMTRHHPEAQSRKMLVDGFQDFAFKALHPKYEKSAAPLSKRRNGPGPVRKGDGVFFGNAYSPNYMTRSTLSSMEDDVQTLRQKINKKAKVPDWAESYIYTAGDRINSVEQYMSHRALGAPPVVAANMLASTGVANRFAAAGVLLTLGIAYSSSLSKSLKKGSDNTINTLRGVSSLTAIRYVGTGLITYALISDFKQ